MCSMKRVILSEDKSVRIDCKERFCNYDMDLI